MIAARVREVHRRMLEDVATRENPWPPEAPGRMGKLVCREPRAADLLGFQPGAEDGFLWPYELQRVSLDGVSSRLILDDATPDRRTYHYGGGYFFFRGVQDLDFTGGVILAGAGTEEDSTSYGHDLSPDEVARQPVNRASAQIGAGLTFDGGDDRLLLVSSDTTQLVMAKSATPGAGPWYP